MNSSLSDADTFTSRATEIPGKGTSEHCLESQITDSDPFSPPGGEEIEKVSVRQESDAFSRWGFVSVRT